MVSKPTVLIVGAGASKPYGYPSGLDLVHQVIDGLHPGRTPPGYLMSCLSRVPFDKDDISQFREALLRSQLGSIDAFLEKRPKFRAIGKIAIAALLIPQEKEDMLFEVNDWYQYFFRTLIANRDSGQNQPLTILTFNYDRSLDHYLYSAFKNTLGCDETAMLDELHALEIVHLHGSLNRLPWQPENRDSARAYGFTCDADSIQRAANEIKIIDENEHNAPQFRYAVEKIGQASRIGFLGFGYHRTNVQRLFSGDWRQDSQVHVIGSAFDLTESEKKQRQQLFGQGGITLGDPGDTCLDFLRKHSWLIS